MADTEGVTFGIELFARWPDMDFNQHMRNAAYLGASEDCRMQYLDQQGFSMATFVALRLGPVVLEDRLRYKKELGLLERFRVELALAGITEDGRRMAVRNTFVHAKDGAVAAVVDSAILWFHLDERRPVAPPDALRDAWLRLARTDDFAWLPSRS